MYLMRTAIEALSPSQILIKSASASFSFSLIESTAFIIRVIVTAIKIAVKAAVFENISRVVVVLLE